MSKQESLNLRRLAREIGQFIRYWGFRKIHGEIWAVVYLHRGPLSGVEIGKILEVSKALISPALQELEEEGLIHQIKSENSRTKRYTAEEDVGKIIRRVLKRREIPMIEKIDRSHAEMKRRARTMQAVSVERLEKMGAMIELAQLGLETLLASEQMLHD